MRYQTIVAQMADGSHRVRTQWLNRPDWAQTEVDDLMRFRGNIQVVRLTLFVGDKAPTELKVPS